MYESLYFNICVYNCLCMHLSFLNTFGCFQSHRMVTCCMLESLDVQQTIIALRRSCWCDIPSWCVLSTLSTNLATLICSTLLPQVPNRKYHDQSKLTHLDPVLMDHIYFRIIFAYGPKSWKKILQRIVVSESLRRESTDIHRRPQRCAWTPSELLAIEPDRPKTKHQGTIAGVRDWLNGSTWGFHYNSSQNFMKNLCVIEKSSFARWVCRVCNHFKCVLAATW